MKASTKVDPFYPPRLGQTCPMSYSLLQGSTENQRHHVKWSEQLSLGQMEKSTAGVTALELGAYEECLVF